MRAKLMRKLINCWYINFFRIEHLLSQKTRNKTIKKSAKDSQYSSFPSLAYLIMILWISECKYNSVVAVWFFNVADLIWNERNFANCKQNFGEWYLEKLEKKGDEHSITMRWAKNESMIRFDSLNIKSNFKIWLIISEGIFWNREKSKVRRAEEES
jgi:hypothetical protein